MQNTNDALKPVSIEDKPLFDSYFQRFQPVCSEYTFTNLFAWRLTKRFSYIVTEDHLLISFLDSSKQKFLLPIGPNPEKIIKSIQQPFERLHKLDMDLIHDRNNDDYVYSLEDMRNLSGDKFSAKRNFIKRFSENNPVVVQLNDVLKNQLLDLQEEWCNTRSCSENPDLLAEDLAIKETLVNMDYLNVRGICIFINNKLEAFAIGEPLNINTFVEHFEKANTKFPGIYQFLLNEFAKSIPSEYIYLNREQDLGIEGIRKAKLSYHPVKMIEKYKTP
jgi:uncharacterized protein